MTQSVTIYRHGAPIYEVEVNEQCRQSYMLMDDDSITLKFSDLHFDENGVKRYPPVFYIGDYCEVDGERYEVNTIYRPTYNVVTGGYDYDMVLTAHYRNWENYLMKNMKIDGKDPDATDFNPALDSTSFIFTETNWNLTARLVDHIRCILRVIYAHEVTDKTTITLDMIDAHIDIDEDYFIDERHLEHKLMKYDGTGIISALDELCREEMYDCEWWCTRSSSGEYTIHIGRLGRKAALSKVIETAVNAAKIEAGESQNPYANRIYAFGGTHNVPYSYRKSVVFTNTRNDGLLWDKYRPLEAGMITDEEISDSFMDAESNVHRVTGVTTRENVIQGSSGLTINLRDYFTDLKPGTYKIRLSKLKISHRFTLSGLVEGGYMGKFDASVEVSSGINGNANRHDTSYTKINSAIHKIEAYNNQAKGSYSESDALKDVEIEVPPNEGNMLAYFHIIINYSWYMGVYPSSTNQQAAYIRALQAMETHDLEVGITFDDGEPFVERISEYFLPVTITDYITGATYNGGYAATSSDRRIIIDGKSFPVGFMYTIEGLREFNVPWSYYTSDEGKDVINGLSELRLRLPIGTGGYVERRDHNEGLVEAVAIHDDIFPSIVTMPIEEVTDEDVSAELLFPDTSTSKRTYKIYTVKAFMQGPDGVKYPFKDDYILDTTEKLQMKFLGDSLLSGMTFDVQFDEHDQTYLIIPNKDYGILLPNETLKPETTDHVLLLGWNCRAIEELGLVEEAERRLLAAAEDDLQKAYEGNATYTVTMYADTSDVYADLTDIDGNQLIDSIGKVLYCTDLEESPILVPGEGVKLRDYGIFGHELNGEPGSSKLLRVIGYTRPLDITWDSPQYTIGEIEKPTRLRILESKIK